MTTTQREPIICIGCLGHSVTCLEHAVADVPTPDCPGCIGHSPACLDGAELDDESRIASAQYWGAAQSRGGLAVELPGDAHSPIRIMFVHGCMTGHGSCTCPVVDEHGHNVNPGRAPLERKAAGRAEGSRKSSETYARRRARKAADELALISPSLWDDRTRQIVATLATMTAPSRIDDVLDELDGNVSDAELERINRKLREQGGTESLQEVFALEVARITGGDVELDAELVVNTEPIRKRCPCTNFAGPCPVHDNGDYRA